jgi:hypothetical protein
MKTLKDIKQDMSELYEVLKAGQVDIKVASELANISGKFLKAEQLEFAKEVFRGRQVRPAILINPDA